MVEMRFLSVNEIIAIHEAQLAEQGGGSPGIRDLGLLESAAAAPYATFGGQLLNSSIAEMAASYLNGIVNNHAFVDGNKRTALATISVFLQLNGLVLDERDEDELVAFLVKVASEKVPKEEIVAFLEPRICVPEVEGTDAE